MHIQKTHKSPYTRTRTRTRTRTHTQRHLRKRTHARTHTHTHKDLWVKRRYRHPYLHTKRVRDRVGVDFFFNSLMKPSYTRIHKLLRTPYPCVHRTNTDRQTHKRMKSIPLHAHTRTHTHTLPYPIHLCRPNKNSPGRAKKWAKPPKKGGVHTHTHTHTHIGGVRETPQRLCVSFRRKKKT